MPTIDLPEPTFVTVDGVSVATYELAPEQDPSMGTVVFCHGTPWSARVWAQAAIHLSTRHRVFLWDMPGYGRSAQGPDVPFDLAVQMSRFAKLLDHWGLARPYVVAHDVGGAVALGAHLLHGRDFSSLFLWDVVTLEPWGSPFFRLVAEHRDVFSALPAALHMALVGEYIAGAARHQLAPESVALLTEPWLTEHGQAAFYRQIAELRSEHTRPVAERLALVRCATAIGWGESDPWIPFAQAARLRRLLPGTPALTALSEVGHLAPLEAAVLVHQALDDWLTDPMSSDSRG